MKDSRNDLLKRREMSVIVTSPSNPGFQGSLKIIADKSGAKEENIAIKAVKGKFGRDTFLINAHIYDSPADKERIEPKKKIASKPGEAK